MEEWNQFLIKLESELGKENIDKWLRTLKVIKFDARNLYLQAENSFQRFWFHQYVKPKLGKLKNRNAKPIKVLFDEKTISKKQKPIEEPTLQFDPIDPIFQLSSFYISKKNKPLLTLIQELIDPKQSIALGSFNPIFIHGEKNSGKTHLLSSIATTLLRQNYNVLFVQADLFSKHVVFSMRKAITDLFRKTYRTTDILILDDIHLFAKKSATQEEFFHTFNYLHTLNKQLIVSSRYPPQELEEVEPRLISRFEWGLSSKLERLETLDLKKALCLRLDLLNIQLKEGAIDFLTQTFPSIEMLVSSLNTLLLRVKIPFDSLTTEYMKQLLSDLIQRSQQAVITSDQIIDTVASYFGITPSDILGRDQRKDCAFARQISMFFLRDLLSIPFTKIGQIFQKDHSTVMSSIKKIEEGVKKYSDFKTPVLEIRKLIEKKSY